MRIQAARQLKTECSEITTAAEIAYEIASNVQSGLALRAAAL